MSLIRQERLGMEDAHEVKKRPYSSDNCIVQHMAMTKAAQITRRRKPHKKTNDEDESESICVAAANNVQHEIHRSLECLKLHILYILKQRAQVSRSACRRTAGR